MQGHQRAGIFNYKNKRTLIKNKHTKNNLTKKIELHTQKNNLTKKKKSFQFFDPMKQHQLIQMQKQQVVELKQNHLIQMHHQLQI